MTVQVLKYIDKLKGSEPIRAKPEFYDPSFLAQMLFIRDNAKFKAGFCTRRAGKSFGVGLELFHNAYYNEGVSCIYIALTRGSAQRIMFKDVYQRINRTYQLGAEFNYTNLTVTLPNGSIIYNVGMDSSPEEAEKALGQKFQKAIIDEAGSFRRDLRPIIYGVLSPALADLGGTCTVIGTPTALTKGLFYDIVWARSEPGWSLHRWTAFDNPFMRDLWQKEITDLINKNPKIVETPYYKQMYLGEYSIDSTKLVYKFNPERNTCSKEAPPLDSIYVMGVDLGFEDPSAFIVCGYNAVDSNLYIVESYKRAHMTISDVAERIKYFKDKYSPYKIIIDNANKQAVEEMKQRYELPLTPADKRGKAEFIEIMNSELILGKIKLCPGNEELEEEWENLIWDETSNVRQEHSACDNHLADASLYAWRHCFQYLSKKKPEEKTTQQKLDIWFDKEAEIVENRNSKPFWERDFV